jgi:hypothetical protein
MSSGEKFFIVKIRVRVEREDQLIALLTLTHQFLAQEFRRTPSRHILPAMYGI